MVLLLILGVELEWSEDDYTGSETSGRVVGVIRPQVSIANPIQVRIVPITYDEIDNFPLLSLPANVPPQAIGMYIG